MYLKGTVTIDNDGNYIIRFNTGGETGNYDIGYNAYFNNDNNISYINNGTQSSKNIYPRFYLYNIEIFCENSKIADFYYYDEYIDGNDAYYASSWVDSLNTGFEMYGDSFFPSSGGINYPYCWANYTSNCIHNHTFCTHNSICQSRYVLFGIDASSYWKTIAGLENKLNKRICYEIGEDSRFLLFYLSRGKPSSQNIEDFMKKIITPGKNKFNLVYGTSFYDADNTHHNSTQPVVCEQELEIKFNINDGYMYSSKDTLNTFIFDSHYERNYFENYLWGNKSLGKWYPSNDVNLNEYLNNLNFEINFKNGDTIFKGNKLNLKYSQKYSWCYHNLYTPQWETKLKEHLPEYDFDPVTDDYILVKPAWNEYIHKYWFDTNKNDITSEEYCKRIIE